MVSREGINDRREGSMCQIKQDHADSSPSHLRGLYEIIHIIYR